VCEAAKITSPTSRSGSTKGAAAKAKHLFFNTCKKNLLPAGVLCKKNLLPAGVICKKNISRSNMLKNNSYQQE